MFKRRPATRPAPSAARDTDSMAARRDAYFRVIRSFLAGQSAPGPSWPSPTSPPAGGPAPSGGPAPFTGAVHRRRSRRAHCPAPADHQPGPQRGRKVRLRGGPPVRRRRRAAPVRHRRPRRRGHGHTGPRSVSRQQLEQVEARVQPILVELFGPGGIENLHGADFPAALAGLEGVHVRGAVNDEQYAALHDAMVQFQAFLGG